MLSKNSAIGFFKEMIRPFRRHIFFQLLIIAIWAFDLSFRPYLVKLMLDDVATIQTHPNDFKWLFLLMCVYVSMSFFLGLVFRLYNYLNIIIRPGLKAQVGEYVVTQLLGHSQQFYHDHLPGNIVNKIKDLTTGVPDLLDLIVDRLIPTFLTIIVALGFLSCVHVNFAIGLIVWMTIYMIGSVYSTKFAQALSRDVAERRAEVSGYYVDLFTNILTVRLFSAYTCEQRITHQKLSLFAQSERNKDFFFMKLFFFQSISFTCYQIVSLYFLYHGLSTQVFSPGDFTLILSINIEVIQVLWLFSRDLGEFASHIGTIQQSLRVVYHESDVQNSPIAKPLQVSHGAIEYLNVCFQHHNQHNLFNKLSVTIPEAQKVGLVGFSGSGKTTFVQLLLRLYDVESGSIVIDGQNIQDVTQESLRESVSFIPQEPGLFHRTIFDNIAYGREASLEEVIAVAKKARAHDFIKRLPMGYQTVLGQGMRLSGGQKQRIAIARAMLKNAPILVIDEATSQLDSLTEREIQEALEELMEGKTTFVIAHRLSTLQKMDRILVFDGGEIVEDGVHSDLIQNKKLYHRLWEMQMDFPMLPE